MAVNQTSTNSNACEKIFRAIHRRSNCPLRCKVTSSAPIDQKKEADEAISTEVPVIINTPRSPAPLKLKADASVKKSGQVEKVASRSQPVKSGVAPSNEIAPTRFAGSWQGKGQKDLEKDKEVQLKYEDENGSDKFSSYIDRAKAEIRTTSGIGAGNGGGSGGKSLSRPDSFNNRVSDYIKRAKLKIRAPSNVVDG